jgi:hypothetical protein
VCFLAHLFALTESGSLLSVHVAPTLGHASGARYVVLGQRVHGVGGWGGGGGALLNVNGVGLGGGHAHVGREDHARRHRDAHLGRVLGLVMLSRGVEVRVVMGVVDGDLVVGVPAPNVPRVHGVGDARVGRVVRAGVRRGSHLRGEGSCCGRGGVVRCRETSVTEQNSRWASYFLVVD